MADVEIGAKLSVDSGNSSKSVSELQGELQKANAELARTVKGSKEYDAAMEKVTSSSRQLSQATAQKTSQFNNLKGALASNVPALGAATEAGSKFGIILKALAANPLILILTAIVAILMALYEAFKSTFDGGKKVEQIFAGIQAATQVLIDRLVLLAGAVIKLFKGDFKGAMDDAKASVTGLGDEVARVYQRTADLTKQLQGIQLEESADEVEKARREKRLALLREQLNDDETSLKQKKAIALELKKDVDQNAKDDLERATKKAAIQKELLLQQRDGARKNAEEINKIDIELAKTETENALEGVRVNKQIRNLERQEEAASRAAKAESLAKSKEQQAQYLDFTNKLYKAQRDNQLAAIKDEAEKEKAIIQDRFNSELRQINQQIASRKLTSGQGAALIKEAQNALNLELSALNDKHDAAELAKKQEFEKAYAALLKDNRIATLTDVRERERQILAEDLAFKTAEVLRNEKLTTDQKNLLIEQLETANALKRAEAKAKQDLVDAQKLISDKELLLKSEFELEMTKGGARIEAQKLYLETSRALQREELELKKASAAELTAFDNETTLARINISKVEAEEKGKHMQSIGTGLSALSQLAGETTVVGKGLAVASAVINTYQGATMALSQGGIWGIVGAAAVIATGLLSVKKILATKVPAKSGGSSPSVDTSAPAPVTPPTPQQQSTQLDSGSIQAIGNASSARAFVVESDVTNNQERITRLNRAARIG